MNGNFISEAKLPLSDFVQSRLKFTYSNGKFEHNYLRDIGFFILWENGRYKEKEVLNEIQKEFQVLYCTNITWSEEQKRNNFNRLYSARLGSNDNLKKHKEVGKGDFLCIVVEDLNPNYTYLQSLSGDVEIGNVNIVNMKYKLRRLLNGNLLHSTSGLNEFFHHGSLIFHERKLLDIIGTKHWDGSIDKLNQDLAGAEGWNDFQEMINIANYCSKWVVLRNHEYLPNKFWGNDNDIDIMCDDLNRFSTAINSTKRKGNISAYKTKVEEKDLPVDIRYVGDFYYDPVWQQEMLNRINYTSDNIPILREDDYFFSLLYHTKLQKPSIKANYISLLNKLGTKIGLNNIDENFIYDDEKTGKLINGFLKGQGFNFYKPNDRSVYLNKNVYLYISARPLIGNIALKKIIIKNIAKITPTFIKNLIPKKLKMLLTK